MSENRRKIFFGVILAVFIGFPATALLEEYAGLVGVAIYVTMVFAALLLMMRFEDALFDLVNKYYIPFLGLVIIGLIGVFAVLYPLETSGRFSRGSDRDEALNIAVTSLLEGQYPYYEKTQLGGEITPLPGGVLLSAPFVLLGNSAFQNIFWILVFLYATGIFLNDKVSALIMLVTALVLSPAVQYEFISGGDLLANSIYVLVLSFFVIRLSGKPDHSVWLRLAAGIALGIGLAWRSNFFLSLPLLFAILARQTNLKSATGNILLVVMSASFITLPFFLFDPEFFAPLTTANKLVQFDELVPFISSGIIVTSMVLSIAFSLILFKKIPFNHLVPVFFLMCALVQLYPTLCGVVLSALKTDNPGFSFMHDRYGLMFLFFGLWGCWLYVFDHAYLNVQHVRHSRSVS